MTVTVEPADHVGWDHPRTAAASRLMVEVGGERGLPVEACLAGTGLTAESLANPRASVEAQQELTIARNLVTRLGDPSGLGVDVGSRYTFGTLGIWGFALLSCPTPREVLRLGVRYAPLSFAFFKPFIELLDAEAHVVMDCSEVPDDLLTFFLLRELTKMATLMPTSLGAPDRMRIETSVSEVEGRALRDRFPEQEILVGCPRDLIALRADILDLPLPQADPATAHALEKQCAALLESRVARRGVSARVRDLLVARLNDPPSMEESAAELNVDPRTLRRQLTAEGTSYRELTDEVRSTVADQLLVSAGLTVAQVAQRLGYHDAAGFTRAYKRWTGTTPGTASRR